MVFIVSSIHIPLRVVEYHLLLVLYYTDNPSFSPCALISSVLCNIGSFSHCHPLQMTKISIRIFFSQKVYVHIIPTFIDISILIQFSTLSKCPFWGISTLPIFHSLLYLLLFKQLSGNISSVALCKYIFSHCLSLSWLLTRLPPVRYSQTGVSALLLSHIFLPARKRSLREL